MSNALYISETYLKRTSVTDENVDMKTLWPTLIEVQEMHVHQVLGSALQEKLLKDINDNTLAGDYKTLVNDYIAPMMRAWVMYEMPVYGLYKFRNKSVSKQDSENSTPLSLQEVKYLRNELRNKAEWFSERTTQYLCKYNNSFPEYTSKGVDQVEPTSDNYTTGLYLGNSNPEKDCDKW